MTDIPLEIHLENIINTMNDGLLVVNPNGEISLVNNAICSILGYEPSELLGKPCSVLDCDGCEKARQTGNGHWCRLFEDKRNVNRKACVVRAKNGTYLPVLKSSSVLTDKGRIIGAVETVTDLSELNRKEAQIKRLRRTLDQEGDFMGFVGASRVMREVFDLIERAASSDAPVIILGESGTGKELAAQAIHELGRRKDGPFIQCNCAALNESVLESELFGHAKGAFTGAHKRRIGRFQAADKGDLFLDEIGDLPLSTQVKLLRVLESKSFEPVGDHRPVSVDVRIITATNRDIPELVRQGAFREDLFFRINVIPVLLPPLRRRKEDIPLLAAHFIRKLARTSGKDITGLAPESLAMLMNHSWPGNVRELKSALDYAFVIAEAGQILPAHLPPTMAASTREKPDDPMANEPEEKRELIQTLKLTRGNKSEAARIIGVTRATILNRMRKYGVNAQTVITGD